MSFNVTSQVNTWQDASKRTFLTENKFKNVYYLQSRLREAPFERKHINQERKNDRHFNRRNLIISLCKAFSFLTILLSILKSFSNSPKV